MAMLTRVRATVMMIPHNKGGNCWVWRPSNSKFPSPPALMVAAIVAIDIVDARATWRPEKLAGVASGI